MEEENVKQGFSLIKRDIFDQLRYRTINQWSNFYKNSSFWTPVSRVWTEPERIWSSCGPCTRLCTSRHWTMWLLSSRQFLMLQSETNIHKSGLWSVLVFCCLYLAVFFFFFFLQWSSGLDSVHGLRLWSRYKRLTIKRDHIWSPMIFFFLSFFLSCSPPDQPSSPPSFYRTPPDLTGLN